MEKIRDLLFGEMTAVWQIVLMSAAYILLFVCIVAMVLMIYAQVQRVRSRQAFSDRVRERFSRSYHRRAEEEEKKWMVDGEQEDVPFMYKMDRLIEYSGLRTSLPWLTSDILVVGYVIICLVGFFLGYFTGIGALIGLLIGGAICFIIRSAIRLTADKNYDEIEVDLLKFLNAVDSASGSRDDIISILRDVSPSMCRPLRRALERCCVEATSTGDVRKALKHLERAVENQQFVVIIRNLGMASETSADYGTVLAECRLGLREHISAREERKVQISNGRVALIQLVVVGSLSFFIMGKIVDVDNVFSYLWQYTVGKIVLVYNVAIIFFCLMDAILLRGRK